MFKISKILILIITLILTVSIMMISCGKNDSSTIPKTPTTISSTPISQSSASSTLPKSNTEKPASPTSSGPLSSALSIIPSLQEIVLNSISATEKIETLKFDMDFIMSFTFPIEQDISTMTMQQKATSLVNIPNQQMYMIVDLVMEIPNEGKQYMSGETYSMDGWMYMRAAAPGTNYQWTKMTLTDNLWAMQNKLFSLMDFLKNPIGLELVDSENINEIDCYVLSVNPDMNSLTNWMEDQIQSDQTSIDLSSVDISKIPQDFMVKEWIAKDSYLPMKQLIDIKLDMSSLESNNLGSATKMNIEMNATFIYYDFDKPIIVHLPPEALNAIEIPIPQ